MRIFFNTLKLDLIRSILSIRFVVAVLSIICIMIISCYGFIADAYDVLSLLIMALTGSGSTLIILFVIPIIPYGIAFAIDAEDRASTFWIIRTGVTKYTLSKIIAATISGFLVFIFSLILFLLLFSSYLPLYVMPTSGDSYAVLLESGNIFAYICFLGVHYALTTALFSCMAMTLSIFIPDKFVVISAPLVLYLFLLRVTTYMPIPGFLQPSSLFSTIYYTNKPITTFLYKLIPVTLLFCFFAYIATKQMKRRVKNT